MLHLQDPTFHRERRPPSCHEGILLKSAGCTAHWAAHEAIILLLLLLLLEVLLVVLLLPLSRLLLRRRGQRLLLLLLLFLLLLLLALPLLHTPTSTTTATMQTTTTTTGLEMRLYLVFLVGLFALPLVPLFLFLLVAKVMLSLTNAKLSRGAFGGYLPKP